MNFLIHECVHKAFSFNGFYAQDFIDFVESGDGYITISGYEHINMRKDDGKYIVRFDDCMIYPSEQDILGVKYSIMECLASTNGDNGCGCGTIARRLERRHAR
jgi:hypothetical protein